VHALVLSDLLPANYPDSVVGQCGFHLGEGSAPVLDGTLQAALAWAGSALHGANLLLEGHGGPEALLFLWGGAESRGHGAGLGFNMNLPLERGTDDKRYLDALHAALARVREHRADALVLAAGLDASFDDPFRGLQITTRGFAAIGRAAGACVFLSLPFRKVVTCRPC
jgi:acetoin utilization deacetylase AcuC-like enzyme